MPMPSAVMVQIAIHVLLEPVVTVVQLRGLADKVVMAPEVRSTNGPQPPIHTKKAKAAKLNSLVVWVE